MRVLQILKTSTGAFWAMRQVRELVRLGVEVHVVLPGPGPMCTRFLDVGATVHQEPLDFPVREPWRAPKTLVRMRQLVGTVQPDLIHSHFVGTTLTMRLGLGGKHEIPRIFQVPGPLHLEHPFFRRAEIATAGESDYWVGSCEWTCNRYRDSGVGAERVFLNYYGLAKDLLATSDPGRLRRELDLSRDTPLVGLVAFMYPPKRYLGQSRGLKGHEDLIDAVAIARQHFPDLKCAMIGGPYGRGGVAYERTLHKYAQDRCGDSVVFLGTRNDVPDLYPGLDIAIHPSHSENLGGAGESILLGIPTIATDVGGFPDLVKPERTGWLVPPRRPDAIAAAIVEILSDRQRAASIAREGAQFAGSLLDIAANAADLVKIYEEVITRHSTKLSNA